MRLLAFSLTGIILSVSSLSYSADQTFAFEVKDLKVSGKFPLNSLKPITVSGVDQANQPYSIQVITKKESGDTYRVSYQLNRNSKKDQSGSVIVKAGNKGQLVQKEDGKPDTEVRFETTVTE